MTRIIAGRVAAIAPPVIAWNKPPHAELQARLAHPRLAIILTFLPETAGGKLREAARQLHLVQTIELSMGGATSIEATRAPLLGAARAVEAALRS